MSALQSPGIPPSIMDVAEPIAQAMGALHRIESTQGAALGEQAPLALDAVRRGLSMLQVASGQHPAVDQAMEAVASSLGVVHSLTQMRPPAPAPAPVAPQPQPQAYVPQPTVPATPQGFGGTVALQPNQGAPQQAYPQPAPPQQPYQQPAPQPAAPQQAYPQAAPQQAYQQPAPQQAYQQPAPQQAAPQQAYQQPAPQQAYQQPAPQPAAPQQAYPQAAPQQGYPQAGGYGAPPPAAQGAPWGQQPQAQPQAQQNPGWQQPAAQAPAPAQPLGSSPVAAGAQVSSVQAPPGVPRAEADLGAHSASNFYKGLSGNDVIESGGIFVATYKIPKMGSQVVIKVALPGGYEFEALGVVEWVREAPNSTAGVEAPPGFGAKFTQITPEGRQLVYRYVRNREPLFHDDL
ncbi:MAG: hypothetical protein IPI67_13445 [Myxococcales bacterium]|nr:hypothetical protein [Myxococcales bacterium]